jgi:1-deoxy-D-xylulose-5-phosphate reductoisomerase
MKKICILGSTGSIGLNTLDVIRQHLDYYKVHSLITNTNIELLAQQISEFKPPHAIIYDKIAYNKFNDLYKPEGTKILTGYEALLHIFEKSKPDLFVNAFVGFAGLQPTMAAIEAKIDIAIANKETLVVAGALIMDSAAKNNVHIIPIDSEHSAIWQCLIGEQNNKIRRLILTASGGPFLGLSKKELKNVTPEQALKHPNWKMGPKITIDSATLMNKGLEVIEAFWLYNTPVDSIEVIIHPQSIIHSMVEFEDKSIKAQLGLPDMRIPIQFALSYPERLPLKVPAMDFTLQTNLSFQQPAMENFPCLGLAYESIRLGQTYPTVLNAANEIAVKAFLEHRLSFADISTVIAGQLEKHKPENVVLLDDYFKVDNMIRRQTTETIKTI